LHSRGQSREVAGATAGMIISRQDLLKVRSRQQSGERRQPA
jgi:hypothetical protein